MTALKIDPLMDSEALEALNRKSSLELFHLSQVIERLMNDPRRIVEIRRRLHLGQIVRFVDCRQISADLALRIGRVVAMKDTQVTIQDEALRCQWKLPYAAIQLPDAASTPPQPEINNKPLCPTRDDFSVGDRVSFDDRYLQTHIGTISRINQRTASVDCNGQNWRVSFSILRHVIEL